jgi:hypothetical protein
VAQWAAVGLTSESLSNVIEEVEKHTNANGLISHAQVDDSFGDNTMKIVPAQCCMNTPDDLFEMVFPCWVNWAKANIGKHHIFFWSTWVWVNHGVAVTHGQWGEQQFQ